MGNWLSEYSEGPAKYFGEVGIIRKILEILDLPDSMKWVVDFGAGNGESASNSRYFIEDLGYGGVLIEPMTSRFEKLQSLYLNYSNVHTLCRFVEFNGPNSLDSILSECSLPKDIGFVSIDIDGNDYHIWDSLQFYRPRMVCIEINETVPPDSSFVQEKSWNVSQGCGILAMTNLAKSKGYELICISENNAFYVLQEYYSLFQINDNSLAIMCKGQLSYTHLFFGYDGSVHIFGEAKLRWHSTFLTERNIQVVPKYLQKFPPNYSKLERFAFRIWRFLNNPAIFIKSIREKYKDSNAS